MAHASPIPILSRRITLCQFGRYSSVRRLQTSTKGALAYPLYPSVAQLLAENNISSSDVSKIPATGPNGRLLKGDVLSYIGRIPTDYPSQLASRIEGRSRLDLSNIKLAAPAPPPKDTQSPTNEKLQSTVAETHAQQPEPIQETRVSVSVSFSNVQSVQKQILSSVGVTIPLTTFIFNAVEIANEDLPLPAKSSQSKRPSFDDLFNEIIGQSSSISTQALPSSSPGDYLPEILSPEEFHNKAIEPEHKRAAGESTNDIINILAGQTSASSSAQYGMKKAAAARRSAGLEEDTSSVFSLTIPEAERVRAVTFLERMQLLLENEPEQLLSA
ncbi:pyridoxine biosynthesis protein [Myotisia sp. PD_48]|nr:pyridoxine biosynthesis protein [Myotisia sp. PD_48]